MGTPARYFSKMFGERRRQGTYDIALDGIASGGKRSKRRLWDHNGFLRLVEASPLSSGVLPSRQQYLIEDYPGTPPPSVYQVTQGTALQAEEYL